MKTVSASAPGKLLLIGDHSVVFGRPCIVTAVDQRITATVQKSSDALFHLDATDLGIHNYEKPVAVLGQNGVPKGALFLEMVYKRFLEKFPQKEGVVVSTKSQFSEKFGFGSSSASTVAFAKALTTLYELHLTDLELFGLCYQAVIDVQSVGSGFDIAAAIWGGTIYYVSPASVVEPLKLSKDTVLPFVVGYTGVKADTATLINKVKAQLEKEPQKINTNFDRMKTLTDQAKEAMEASDWENVGKLMNENQELLRQLDVSSSELEALIKASVDHGAFGAKLSGAGGGDCMLAVAAPQKKQAVEEAITIAGGTVMKVSLHAPGAKIESTT